MTDIVDRIGFAGRERIAVESGQGLELFVSRQASDDFVGHLEHAEFGTSGIRYRRLDVREQLKRLASPVFVELRKDGRLAGTYALAVAGLRIEGAPSVGVYRALLHVEDRFKRRGLGHWLVENTLEWIADTFRAAGQPVFSWGCIESANERSIRLLRTLGARPVGRVETSLVYRQWPRARIALDQVDGRELASLNARRIETLDDCGLIVETALPGDYFCVRRNGEIVAGARACLTRLRMSTMGGTWDALYRHVLRHAPPARRRFDPEDFRYLRLSDPLFVAGEEDVWADFLSSLMDRFGVHMTMFALDPNSRLHRQLSAAKVFGRFGRATRQSIEVLGQAWHCDPNLVGRVTGLPLGIGPLDI